MNIYDDVKTGFEVFSLGIWDKVDLVLSKDRCGKTTWVRTPRGNYDLSVVRDDIWITDEKGVRKRIWREEKKHWDVGDWMQHPKEKRWECVKRVKRSMNATCH